MNELDITQIPLEESMDASQSSAEDLKNTLEEEMALRKNLFGEKFESIEVEGVATKSKRTETTKRAPMREIIEPMARPVPDASSKTESSGSIQQRIAHFEQKLAENRNAAKPPPVPNRVLEKKLSSKLQVFLRIRPCDNPEDSVVEVVQPENVEKQPHPTTIRTYPSSEFSKNDTPKEYEFTQVFDAGSSQNQIYHKAAAPLANDLCYGNQVGRSALVFCYGITNAGKTHTVLGDLKHRKNRDSWGIVPRCLHQVLQKVKNTDLKVCISYFEIYNENVFDLLPSDRHAKNYHVGAKPLKIRERHGQTVIKGLSKHYVDSLEQGLDIIKKSNESRHTATNHLNRHSSRSHCICQLTVTKVSHIEQECDDNASVDTEKLLSKPDESATLWIVDLAGSERSKRTNVGTIRLKEAAFINKSLMTLMGCLTRGEKNYRDSKLTTLFMHHWMKMGPTTMIVNIHPSKEDHDETQHVLSYAISSKLIPNLAEKGLGVKTLATGSQSEYDYDGRRVKDQTAKAAAKKKPTSKMVMPNAGRKRKLATKSDRHTKTDSSKEKEVFPMSLPALDIKNQPRRDTIKSEQSNKTTKRQKVEPATKKTTDETQNMEALKKELSLAKAEIQMVRARNKQLEEKVDSIETSVRNSCSEEMLEEISRHRQRYESTIRDLKMQVANSQVSGDDKKKLAKAEYKIQELSDKVAECEEEMGRMTHEIVSLQETIQSLETAKKRAEDSKAEIIRNYEQLLADGEGSETSGDEAEDEPESRAASQITRLQCSTEPRPRRKLALSKKTTEDGTPIKTNVLRMVSSQPKPSQPKPYQPNGGKNNENAPNPASSPNPRARRPLGKISVNKKQDAKETSAKLLLPRKLAKESPSAATLDQPPSMQNNVA